MAKRRRENGYNGVLAQQILLPDPYRSQRFIRPYGPFVCTHNIKIKERRLTVDQRNAKLPTLFSCFGIDFNDPNCWQQLAMALAEKHVPGFRARRTQGAPRIESVDLYCKLYRYANKVRASRNRLKSLDSELCVFLTKKDSNFRFKFPELGKVSAKRLQNILIEARKLRRERVEHMVRYWFFGTQGDDDFLNEIPIWLYEKWPIE